MANQQVLDFDCDKKSDHDQQHTNEDCANCVPQGIAGEIGNKNGHNCKDQPQQSGDILSKHDDQCTAAAMPEPLQKTTSASLFFDFTQTTPQRNRFRDDCE